MSQRYRVNLIVQWSVFGFFLLMAPIVLTGCSPHYSPDQPTIEGAGDVGGGWEDVVLDLPFASGYQSLCTQGAKGSYSHTGTSTKEDVDFDTPNGVNDLVYAPVGGVASVHTESASRNFGYHVNIDLGNGSYVVVAHMADIFVSDGEEVASGELLGYEGCTGNCSGAQAPVSYPLAQHSEKAEFGTSVATSYWLDDVTTGEEGQTVGSEAMTCGADSGHVYGSKLAVPSFHPDGSLAKTPDDANVYLIENGTRRWIETEAVFWSLGYEFSDVALISPNELACYDVGEPLDNETAITAVTDDSGLIWILVGTVSDPERYRSRVRTTGADGVLQSWGLGYRLSDLPPGMSDAELETYPASEQTAVFRDGTLVREETKSDVYAVSGGVAMPIASYDVLLKLGWAHRPIVIVEDGDVSAVQGAVGNCATDSYCLDEALIETCVTGTADEGGDAGGAEDTGNPSDTGNEEDSGQSTNADSGNEVVSASSMLEGEIDDGEFGFAYLPPDGFDAVGALLIGTVVTDDGNVLDDGVLYEVNNAGGEIIYTTSDFPDGGVSFYFVVQESEEMDYHYGCELNDALEPEMWGEPYAQFGADVLPVVSSTLYDTGIGCALKVHVPPNTIDPGKADFDGDGFLAEDDCDDNDVVVNPGAVELCDSLDNDCDGKIDEGDTCVDTGETGETGQTIDTGVIDTATDDSGSVDTDTGSTIDTASVSDTGTTTDTGTTADTGTESGSSTKSVEICYAPGDTMLAGELYLDGGFFTAWDTAPADEASSGDTKMCATETVVTGESVKMNAWYMGASSSEVLWAAFNDFCLSIDWRGALTVDGAAVSVTTAPWSASAWASDPCLTGGDAFFFVP